MKKKPPVAPRRGRHAKPVDLTRAAGHMGLRIRTARLARDHLSVADAAQAVGVPATRWYDWEAGRAFPWPPSLIAAICRVLGCALEDLIPEAVPGLQEEAGPQG